LKLKPNRSDDPPTLASTATTWWWFLSETRWSQRNSTQIEKRKVDGRLSAPVSVPVCSSCTAHRIFVKTVRWIALPELWVDLFCQQKNC